LIEHWDGSAWSVVSSPNLGGATESVLQGLTVIASNDVWAVGYGRVDDQFVLLTEHWNGATWKVVPALPDDNELIMTSVSAVATNDVWAGGVGTDDLTPLAFHWDGTQWSAVGVPFTFYLPSGIYAVAAIASDDVWLMGPDGRYATFNLNWNGSQIEQVQSPKFKNGRTYGGLRGIVALAADNIWSVGGILDGSFNQTLIEHWDGSDWAIDPSPTVPNADSDLGAVTTTPDGTLWAVGGDAPSGGSDRTLILRNAP
jgi:hypothetical protein